MSGHTVGIIAEFDPFHRGHEYLIQRAREQFPGAPMGILPSGAVPPPLTPTQGRKWR